MKKGGRQTAHRRTLSKTENNTVLNQTFQEEIKPLYPNQLLIDKQIPTPNEIQSILQNIQQRNGRQTSIVETLEEDTGFRFGKKIIPLRTQISQRNLFQISETNDNYYFNCTTQNSMKKKISQTLQNVNPESLIDRRRLKAWQSQCENNQNNQNNLTLINTPTLEDRTSRNKKGKMNKNVLEKYIQAQSLNQNIVILKD